MKAFREFLEEMSVSDAYRVFGLSSRQNISPIDLKKRYKNLALKNHPDRGGDLKAMQDINVAFEVLSQNLSKSSKPSNFDIKQKTEMVGNAAKEAILSEIDAKKYEQYFESIFGEKFDHGFQIKRVILNNIINVLFANKDKTIVFNLNIINDFSRMINAINDKNLDMEVTIQTDILHQRRQIKLFKQNYKFDQSISLLRQPSNLFPKQKLLQQIQKSSTRKFTKKDALSILKNELGAILKQDFAFIPLNNDLRLAIYRATSMGVSYWGINGIYQKSGRVVDAKAFPVIFIYEREPDFSYFIDAIKKIKGLSDLSKLTNAINILLANIKRNRQ